MASNARNLSKLLGTSTQVPTTALPPAIADLETVGQTLSGGEIAPSSIKSNTLTQSFDSNQAVTFNMADSIDAVSPIVSVFKEVPQSGFSSKGQWDVNANATNYEFFDEKPISYSSATLTPSATGDGTFTSSNPTVSGYDISLISSGYVRQINSWDYTGAQQTKSAEFSSNGTKIYFCETNSDKIKVFSLSTAFDITTIAGTASSEYTLSLDPYAVRVNSAGTKLWVGYDSSIEQFTLGTAHDLSTATSDGTWTVGTYIRDIRFNNDGTKIYIADFSSDDIKQYSLTTAYDITGTKTLDGSITGLTNPTAILFNNDGSKLYYGKDADNDVFVKNLGTVYDITTNVSDGTTVAYDSSANANNWPPKAMAFNSDGTRLFILHIYNTSPFHRYLSEFTSGSTNAFNAADVGKKVVGNSGSAIITATSGTYKSVTAFASTSAISSWQLFGAQGKSDGSGIKLAQAGSPAQNINAATANSLNSQSSSNLGLSNTFMKSWHMSDDGTHIAATPSNTQTLMYQMSTPFDISTIGSSISTLNRSQYASGFWMNGDGTRYVIANFSGTEAFYMYTMSTPYNFSTSSANGSFSDSTITSHNPAWVEFSTDGTKMFYGFTDISTAGVIGVLTMSTPWNLSTGSATYLNFNSTFGFTAGNENTTDWFFNSDGTRFFINSGTKGTVIRQYNLTTAYDLTTASYSNLNLSASNSSEIYHMQKADNGTKLIYAGRVAGQDTQLIGVYDLAIDEGTTTPAYNQYFPALTNSSNGQINSSSWLDINSMTADETKNDGDVFYAVSTDNRTSWGVAKASDGVRKIARNNSGTWQYNNDAGTSTTVNLGFSLASPSYDNKSYSVSHSSPRGMYLKSDGTELYIGAYTGHVYQFTLSTPNDISTASSTGNYNIDEAYDTVALTFKPDGTKMYASDATTVYQYTLSTAWDVTTASYDSVSYTPSDIGSSDVHSLNFNSDGTKLFISDVDSSIKRIREYTLSTPYVVSSASTTSNYLYHAKTNVRDVDFNSDGTKIFLSSYSTQSVYQYNLASPYTLSSSQGTTADAEYDASSVISSNLYSIAFSNDGTKLFILESNTDTVKQFSTTESQNTIAYGISETWVNGTNNNEHATLQQALTSQAFNRMNKAQLDAVADGYHFSQDSADTLDLMIAPYATSGTSPISDGVTINYDAEALIREAIPGTDYIAEFPNPTTLNITAVGAANLKIRAQ